MERIGEIMKSKNQKSGQESKCKCGAVIEPVGSGKFTVTPTECRECDAKTQQAVKERAQQGKRFQEEMSAEKERGRYESLIPKRYMAAKMEHLSPALQKALTELALDQGVYLWGPVGSGKTYALAALCRYFVDRREPTRRIVWGRFLYKIRQTFNGYGDENEIVSPLFSVANLVIEDIGTAASMNKQESDFAVKTLLMILDSRIEDCLPSFITSNLSLENLGRTFDSRIASRIQQACTVIELTGKDRRTGA